MAEIDSELVVVRKCYCWGRFRYRNGFALIVCNRCGQSILGLTRVGLDIGPDNIFVYLFRSIVSVLEVFIPHKTINYSGITLRYSE